MNLKSLRSSLVFWTVDDLRVFGFVHVGCDERFQRFESVLTHGADLGIIDLVFLISAHDDAGGDMNGDIRNVNQARELILGWNDKGWKNFQCKNYHSIVLQILIVDHLGQCLGTFSKNVVVNSLELP